MVVKIENAITKRAKESYVLARKIDDNVEALEMKMELMTPAKRLETIKRINIMKKQRKTLDGGVADYRKRLTKMLNNMKKSSLVLKKQAKKADKVNKMIQKKHLTGSKVLKRGTAAVLAQLDKKVGKGVIDTNKKQKATNLKLKKITVTVPKKKECAKKPVAKKVKKSITLVKKAKPLNEKKVEGLKKLVEEASKEEILKMKKEKLQKTKKVINKAAKVVKKLDAMQSLLKEMAASKEMIEEEIKTALEI